MKKIVSPLLSIIFLASLLSETNATENMEGNTSMMSNMKMEGKMDMDKSGMESMDGMKSMMNPEMMKKMKSIMMSISNSLDEKGKEELKKMRKSHMSDMMSFMKRFKGNQKSEEKMKAKKEMKQKHFADLKELLKGNPELYLEVSSKMELIMENMMKKMHSKKIVLSSQNQTRLDSFISKLFIKLNKLDKEIKKQRVKSLMSKLEKLKSKYRDITNKYKKNKINNILDYIKQEVSMRAHMDSNMGSMMGNMDNDMNMGAKLKLSSLMESEENLSKAKKVEVVELADGDVYTMEVTKVEKEIGNAKVVMLAYNGSVPGPVIKVKKDSQVTIKFINKVKGLETTLHSHGLRLDNKMDGVPNFTQDVLKYGDTFEYKLDFVDEGVYWYHPHVREDLQQELGLYGNYIVDPVDTKYWSKVNREETLILDDILLEDGKIGSMSDQFANYVMMGRFGNTMLVNGESDYNLNVKKGESIRMYFTNVANTRVFQVAIPGAKMKLVGGDIGKYEREEMIDSFVMAPAERYIVDVYFDKSGIFDILNKNPEFSKKLGTITVSDTEVATSYKTDFETLRVNQDVISDIDNFRKYFDTMPDKYLDLSVGMKGNMGMSMDMSGESDGDKIEWSDKMGDMNKKSNSNMTEWKLIDRKTGKENMDINWKFKVGDKVKIRIYNDPNSMHPMQHPIHFHGQRFLVVSQNGDRPDNMVWKDTAMVKTGEYIDIVMDITNPGEWMSHCHIAEHLSAGMMMRFSVEE